MVVFVTSNEDKFKEFKKILDIDLRREDIDLEEIQAVEIDKVIKHKLSEAYERLEEPVLVEDSGLFIEDWNRLPGALTKFFMSKLGYGEVCEMLGNERSASAETYIGYKDEENTKIFKGKTDGTIPKEPRGEGFGWDVIFIPEGYDRTFGEMDKREKNNISMRKRALEKFVKWFENR